MTHIEFQPCPDCGTDNPEDYTVENNGEPITADEAHIFFKSSAPDHLAVLISCDVCGFSVARSVSMN
jgi:predicted RNA-binding Zn-ribbon protein involved in translation (DUF1610 family)